MSNSEGGKTKKATLILAWVMVPFEFNPLWQFYKSWSSGSIQSVAWETFAMITGIGLVWLCYGLSIKSWPLVASNAIKLITSSAVLALCFYLA